VAIDTRQKRQSSIELLLRQLPPGVDPAIAGFPASSRQAAAHVYSGIIAAAGAVFQAGQRAFTQGARGPSFVQPVRPAKFVLNK